LAQVLLAERQRAPMTRALTEALAGLRDARGGRHAVELMDGDGAQSGL